MISSVAFNARLSYADASTLNWLPEIVTPAADAASEVRVRLATVNVSPSTSEAPERRSTVNVPASSAFEAVTVPVRVGRSFAPVSVIVISCVVPSEDATVTVSVAVSPADSP